MPRMAGAGQARIPATGAAVAAAGVALGQLTAGFEPALATLAALLLTGLVVLRFARRTGIIWLGVVSFALLIGNAPFAAGALMHPESPADFVPVSMLTVGGVVAAAAGTAALRSARRQGAGSRRAAIAVAAAVVAGTLIAAGGWATAARRPVDMRNYAFQPEQVGARRGTVRILVTNSDMVHHTFTVDELGVDENIEAGESRLIVFEAGPGTYRFYCAPHDPAMDGDLIVR
ncbi:MAG TPA: cupredoxin domain-containing protein [Actinomycetota bacterium]|nr:cupredoxin domain-containing protein [Actinomycetota bacterium]